MICDYCGDAQETVFHGERDYGVHTKAVKLCAKCLVMEAGLWVESKVRIAP